MKDYLFKKNTLSSTDDTETTDTANEENSVRMELKNVVSTSAQTLTSASYQAPDTDPTQLAKAISRYVMQSSLYKGVLSGIGTSHNTLTLSRPAGTTNIPTPARTGDFPFLDGDSIRVYIEATGNTVSNDADVIIAFQNGDTYTTHYGTGQIPPKYVKSNGVYEFIFIESSQSFLFVSSEAHANQSAQETCPVGSVIAFFGTTAPIGWLACDGNPVSSTLYPELSTLLVQTHQSANTPDFRGHTLTGAKAQDHLRIGKTVGEHPYAHRHLTSTASNYAILEDPGYDSMKENMRIGSASTGGAYTALSLQYATGYGDANWGNMDRNGLFAWDNSSARVGYSYDALVNHRSVYLDFNTAKFGYAYTNIQPPYAHSGAFDYFGPDYETSYMSFSGHTNAAEMLGANDMGVSYDSAAGKWKGQQQRSAGSIFNHEHANTHVNDVKSTKTFKDNFDATGADFPSTKVFSTSHKVEKKYCEFGDTLIANSSIILDARNGSATNKHPHSTVAPDTAPYRYKVNTRQVGTSYAFTGAYALPTKTPKETFDDPVNRTDGLNASDFDRQYGMAITWCIKHDYI